MIDVRIEQAEDNRTNIIVSHNGEPIKLNNEDIHEAIKELVERVYQFGIKDGIKEEFNR